MQNAVKSSSQNTLVGASFVADLVLLLVESGRLHILSMFVGNVDANLRGVRDRVVQATTARVNANILVAVN